MRACADLRPVRGPARSSRGTESPPRHEMPALPGLVARLAADCRGATAIEYALLAALIGGVLVGVMSTLSHSMTGMYSHIEAEVIPKLEGDGS